MVELSALVDLLRMETVPLLTVVGGVVAGAGMMYMSAEATSIGERVGAAALFAVMGVLGFTLLDELQQAFPVLLGYSKFLVQYVPVILFLIIVTGNVFLVTVAFARQFR